MAVKQEKEMLKRANPNKQWAKKVDKMSPSEVSAVLARLRQQNKI